MRPVNTLTVSVTLVLVCVFHFLRSAPDCVCLQLSLRYFNSICQFLHFAQISLCFLATDKNRNRNRNSDKNSGFNAKLRET